MLTHVIASLNSLGQIVSQKSSTFALTLRKSAEQVLDSSGLQWDALRWHYPAPHHTPFTPTAQPPRSKARLRNRRAWKWSFRRLRKCSSTGGAL